MLAFINQSVLVSTMFLETFLFFFSQSHLDIHNGDSLMAAFPLKFPTFFWLSEWVKLLSRVWLFATPWTIAHQAPLSMGFSRQEYWSGLPFPSPGDLPDPGIEPRPRALQADTLTSEPPGKPLSWLTPLIFFLSLQLYFHGPPKRSM